MKNVGVWIQDQLLGMHWLNAAIGRGWVGSSMIR